LSTEINKKGYYYVNAAHPEKCTGCGICAINCPDIAIEVYKF
jgi:2-oxoglutarate ferredoxin oxidoreductase subunit delta